MDPRCAGLVRQAGDAQADEYGRVTADVQPPAGGESTAPIVIVLSVLVLGMLLVTGLGWAFQNAGDRLLPPNANSSRSLTFTLSAERPTVVRAIHFQSADAPQYGDKATLMLHVRSAGGWFRDDMWVSIYDPETGQGMDYPNGTGHAGFFIWGHAQDCPSSGCDATFVIVVRWLRPTSGTIVPCVLSASARVSPNDWATPGPRPIVITEVPSLAFTGAPAVLTASAAGTSHLTPSSPPQAHHLELRVPAAALAGPLRFPLAGRLLLQTMITQSSGRPADVRLTVTLPSGKQTALGDDESELDWLAACRPGVDCVVPLVTTVSWWTSSDAYSLAPDAFVDVAWSLQARLEDLQDGAHLPAVPITLVEVAQG